MQAFRQLLDKISAGQAARAQELTMEHMDIVDLRKSEVERAVSRGLFEQAKVLLKEGIRIAERKQHPGTVSQWERELWRVAELENDVPTIRHYAKHFAFGRGFTKEAYDKWKATYPPAEWEEVIEKYIREKSEELSRKKAGAPRFWDYHLALLIALAPVHVEEQHWERLMELVQNANNLNSTLTYHKYLKANYASELLDIYVTGFEKAAEQASNRKDYSALVAIMKEVLKDIPEGEEKIRTVAQTLRKRYARRPALLDELKKL